MSNANSPARSLRIISKNLGWDPDKIEGFGELPSHEPTVHNTFKAGPLPKDPQEPCPDPSAPGPDSRGPGPGGSSHGKHDPYAGK